MAIRGNIAIDQGSTFSTAINVTDANSAVVDLTGYTGEAQIRKHYTSSTAYDFTVTITANTGIVTLAMTANNTANIDSGRYVYDCEITNSSGVVTRLVEGIVTVTPQVTRA